ncbi:hypothetical protein A9Q95_13600 [Rhodobacterales bacterium 59_46_T64]|nr:hypothetical protein A9Q95_13600 [Rhodobacterales bacterium 59_46_T64]
MPFRSWLCVFALGLTFATSGQAQQQAQDEQEGASQQQQPTAELPIPIAVEIIEDQAAADTRKIRESESRQRDIDDLIAQQGMNESTRSMNDATQEMRDYVYIQTVLIGLGTALLVVTLMLTWGANRAAVKAAMVSLRVERPWIKVSIETGDELFGTPPDMWICYELSFENVGKSPATITDVFMEYRLPGIEGKPIRTDPIKMGATVFPSGVETVEVKDHLQVTSNNHSARLVVCTHYVDLLTNEKHWVERQFSLHAAERAFYFNREIRLPKENWGFWERGEYRVDHD